MGRSSGWGWWFDAGELVTDPDLYAQLGAYPAAFPTGEEAPVLPRHWPETPPRYE